MITQLRRAYATECGMHAVWDPTAFADIEDYDSWEEQLLEHADIERHIAAGHFVPINIHTDGVFEVAVRVGKADRPEALTGRESKYLVVRSEPYLFRSNGRVCVSSIEHIGAQMDEAVGVLPLASGDYAVTVHLIGWDDEPGMKDAAGNPKPAALPDFVVLINPSRGKIVYRTKVDTFPLPR